MAELPVLTADDFVAFFQAIHGSDHVPFPWQNRLAARVALSGWPRVLDLPTSSGKTAAIDIAIFQLALEAGRLARRAPLRIVYVVDRRTVVDQAFLRAKRIAQAIEGATGGVLGAVRERLSSYSREGAPLAVTLLRGGIARSDEWARSPDQPLVAVSTVDQVGSRLLFRGYGVSDSMKPVHAGLLGNDVLYLLDEVHLSQPFKETLRSVVQRYGGWGEQVLDTRVSVVEMSATPGQSEQDAFGLLEDDWANEELARRLNASKPASLKSVGNRQFLNEVEHSISCYVAPGATVAVIVNRVALARDIHERLRRSLKSTEVHLLTGRMRPLERQGLELELFPRLASGRSREATQRPLVVVATQCIEAGADFDFDALVTECASLDALRQRFGRLDRLGSLGSAPATIIARTETLADDPVYGSALAATWDWLFLQAEVSGEGVVDFGIAALSVPDDVKDLVAPRASAPVLMPAHLDAWVQTSPTPNPDPEVALWLHGPKRGAPDVQIIWRADLSHELLQRAVDGYRPAIDFVVVAVDALAPATGEAMAVPFAAARRWLEGRAEPEISDVEGAQDEEEEEYGWGNGRERVIEPRLAFAWRGDDSRVIKPSELRPGQTIIVPAAYGGVAHGTWSPMAADPVWDLAEASVFKQRGRAFLRLHPSILAQWFAAAPPAPVPGAEESDPHAPDERSLVLGWLAGLDASAAMREIVAHLLAEPREIVVDRLDGCDLGQDGREGSIIKPYFIVSSRRRMRFNVSEVTSEDDRASFIGQSVSLNNHLAGVGEYARDFAERAGLPSALVADIELAARWHDVGKADPRFQRLLHGGSEFKALVAPELLAKSALPMSSPRMRDVVVLRSGYPKGARHELMSVALMANAELELASQASDWELVLHLVGSHHGRCRPLAPWVHEQAPIDVALSYEGLALSGTSAHGLERLDSGVGGRFWRLVRRYGWWGLAWMEAILRLADHRRSETEQREGGSA